MKLLCLFIAALLAGCSSLGGSETVSLDASNSNSQGLPTNEEEANASKPTERRDVCHRGKYERTVEVLLLEPGCEVRYTKFGKTETVAKSRRKAEHCIQVSQKIIKNLKAAGFDCD